MIKIRKETKRLIAGAAGIFVLAYALGSWTDMSVSDVELIFKDQDSFFSTLLPISAILILAVLTLLLVTCMPKSIAVVRINVIWVATLVAILTLVFGQRLIGILAANNGPGEMNGDTQTIEIVLSSLVGVGIGGLIAIAGQLVQDSPNDRQGNPGGQLNTPDQRNGGSTPGDAPTETPRDALNNSFTVS